MRRAFALLLALLLSPHSDAAGQAQDVRFAEGLRQRRLFGLAESFAAERLESSAVPPLERAELLIGLLRTYGEHALHSPPSERQKLWAEAARRSDEFRRKYKKNPRVFLVQLQAALGLLAQGELARQEAQVGGSETEAMTAARAQTRRAIREFETLLQDLEQAIPQRRQARSEAGELSADELFSLKNNVLLRLGQAYENQALCYEPQSDDRVASLTVALEHLAESLKQLPAGHSLTLDVRLQQAVCFRLRGDLPQSERLLASLISAETPIQIRQQATAELVRIRLTQGQAGTAREMLRQAGSGHPELDYAYLETLATLIKNAGSHNADPLRKEAIALVSKIEDRHGAYWGRRSSQLLVRIAGDAEGGAGLEILRRTAEALYLKGDYDRALPAYEKASDRAVALGQIEAAFNHRLTAALIEKKRDHADEYVRRLRETALQLAQYKKASDAHLGAISASIRLARSDRSKIKLYEQLLLEHLETWPGSESADQVRLWLGRMRAAQKNWPEAIAAYSSIRQSSNHFGAAVRSVSPCWQAHLQSVQAAGGEVIELADQAASFFESVLVGSSGEFPETWSSLDQIAALDAARIRIRYRPNDLASSERLLKAALEASPDAEGNWTRNARAWLVVALSGQGRASEAAESISALAGANPNDLFQVVVQLHELGTQSNPAAARALQSVEQQAVNILTPGARGLSEADQLTLQIIQGELLLQAGKAREAQSVFSGLAAAHPKRGDVREAYAKALSATRATANDALGQWRIVAAGSKKESGRWYRAKYYLARAYFDLGKKKDAADRIRYLQQTSKMDTPLKAQFNTLLQECLK